MFVIKPDRDWHEKRGFIDVCTRLGLNFNDLYLSEDGFLNVEGEPRAEFTTREEAEAAIEAVVVRDNAPAARDALTIVGEEARKMFAIHVPKESVPLNIRLLDDSLGLPSTGYYLADGVKSYTVPQWVDTNHPKSMNDHGDKILKYSTHEEAENALESFQREYITTAIDQAIVKEIDW